MGEAGTKVSVELSLHKQKNDKLSSTPIQLVTSHYNLLPTEATEEGSRTEEKASSSSAVLFLKSSLKCKAKKLFSQPQRIFQGKVPVRSINQHKRKYKTSLPSVYLWLHYTSLLEFYCLKDRRLASPREQTAPQGTTEFKTTEVCSPPLFLM